MGFIAWVRDGALHVRNLDTCEERVLVEQGADPPIRFSHDGRWIAFGRGTIVPTDGGPPQSPAGELTDWQWSPKDDVVAGVTGQGGVVLGGPSAERSELLPEGSGGGHVAFSPDGRSLAVDVGGDRVEVVGIRGGRAATVYQVSPGTDATAEVVGWSPDGRWILFFARFPKKAGVPLNAVPANGGPWVNVFEPVLPYPDFLSWCGDRLAVSGGAKGTPSEGSQILLTGPPDWRFSNLSVNFSQSWIWPGCSPDGRWVAATVMPSARERPPGSGARSLWLLSADGKERARLTRPSDTAYELARWSADGRFLLVVRRGPEPDAPGVLSLLRIDPKRGRAKIAVRAVARLGPSPGENGHGDWSAISDWYRPG
jgi:Tol biopolymer transport system component